MQQYALCNGFARSYVNRNSDVKINVNTNYSFYYSLHGINLLTCQKLIVIEYHLVFPRNHNYSYIVVKVTTIIVLYPN